MILEFLDACVASVLFQKMMGASAKVRSAPTVAVGWIDAMYPPADGKGDELQSERSLVHLSHQ